MNLSDDSGRERRRALMLRALEDQLRSAETPEVQEQYDRLRGLGHTDAETRELMARILAFYIWHTMRQDAYTYGDYVAELARLPEIHWHDEDELAE